MPTVALSIQNSFITLKCLVDRMLIMKLRVTCGRCYRVFNEPFAAVKPTRSEIVISDIHDDAAPSHVSKAINESAKIVTLSVFLSGAFFARGIRANLILSTHLSCRGTRRQTILLL